MPIEPENLLTHSLRSSSKVEQITRIIAAALNAVDPDEAVRRFVIRERDALIVGGQNYDLKRYQHVYLIGAGKASAPMSNAAAGILGEYLTSGILITKEGHTGGIIAHNCRIHEAAHPVPDTRGVEATRSILELLYQVNEKDLVICLVSGGGSALLTCPTGGITLHDLQSLTSRLLASGASIHEINTLRKHIDRVKGGGLASAATPASMIALILSDVVGDPLDRIASGPTSPD